MTAPPRRRRPDRRARPDRRTRSAVGRAGLTLLELVVAAALVAGVAASLHTVLRGVTVATDRLRGENDVLRHADAGLRFMTRRCRDAVGVREINTGDGSFTMDLAGGETLKFIMVGGPTVFVMDMNDSRHADGVRTFMDHVTAFTFEFYEADGVTLTTDPAAAQLVRISLTVDLPRDHQPARTVSSRVWVRQW